MPGRAPPCIADIDDLERPPAAAGAGRRKVAKVGKMMGIGLRVGALDIKDGWDITDSVPIQHQAWRGGYRPASGSGYWTIWGWTWN